MALIKNDIPILEYDTEKQAVLMPGEQWDNKFTKCAVMLFMEPEIEDYVATHECEMVGEFVSVTKMFKVYKTIHKGKEITFCQAPLGGAGAVQIMEQLIKGGKKDYCDRLLWFFGGGCRRRLFYTYSCAKTGRYFIPLFATIKRGRT